MQTQPVLLIVLAGNCGACQNFKTNHLRATEDAFRKYGKVNVVIVPLDRMRPLPNEINGIPLHSSLNSIIKFYPTFALIPWSSWTSGSLAGVSVYGVDIEGKAEQVPVLPATAENLLAWVKNQVDQRLTGQVMASQVGQQTNEPGRVIPTEGSCRFRVISHR